MGYLPFYQLFWLLSVLVLVTLFAQKVYTWIYMHLLIDCNGLIDPLSLSMREWVVFVQSVDPSTDWGNSCFHWKSSYQYFLYLFHYFSLTSTFIVHWIDHIFSKFICMGLSFTVLSTEFSINVPSITHNALKLSIVWQFACIFSLILFLRP